MFGFGIRVSVRVGALVDVNVEVRVRVRAGAMVRVKIDPFLDFWVRKVLKIRKQSVLRNMFSSFTFQVSDLLAVTRLTTQTLTFTSAEDKRAWVWSL